MVTGGPLSLRPFLDKEWFKQGGASNVSLAISFFDYTLPFMPLGSASSISPGSALPSFHQLLSPQRFLLRCISIKTQAAHLIKHPLFLEIAEVHMPERAESLRNFGSHWRQDKAVPKDLDDRVISAVEQASIGPVWTHGGSSFGNVNNDVLLFESSLADLVTLHRLIFFFHANTPRPLNRPQRISSVYEHPLICCDVDQQSYTSEQQQSGNSSICMSFLIAMFMIRKRSRNGWRRSKMPPRYTLVRTVKDTRHTIFVILDGKN